MKHIFLPHADDVSARYSELFMVDQYTWRGQLKPLEKSLSTDLDKLDKIHFGQCKINLGWFYVYIDNYIRKFPWLPTFFTYQLYLGALVELSPEHLLYFEAEAVYLRGKPSPSVTVAHSVHGFLSFVCAAPLAQAVCACRLLNIQWFHQISLTQFLNSWMLIFTMVARNMAQKKLSCNVR